MTAPPVRPLAPIADIAADRFPTPATLAAILGSDPGRALRSYFTDYPALSLLYGDSRPTLFALARLLRPRAIAEIGTQFAGTAELLARALWENGSGELHTTDPFGADRCPGIIDTWPRELQALTTFYPHNSMTFLAELGRRRVALDLVLVDGNHDFEFALFDLQMSARLLRPGGIVVMDNAEQTGPFQASRAFLAARPGWRELGETIGNYDPDRPFEWSRASLPGTSFVVLQAPDHLSIGAGPHSWGQALTLLSSVAGLRLELLPQSTAGTLLYRILLRGFADGNRYVVELPAAGGVRLDLDGAGRSLVHTLAVPLAIDAPADRGPVSFTFELDLSWRPDAGCPALRLAGVPAPLGGGYSV